MQPNRVFDILKRFFVGITLAIAALKFRTERKIAVLIVFDNGGKTVRFHIDKTGVGFHTSMVLKSPKNQIIGFLFHAATRIYGTCSLYKFTTPGMFSRPTNGQL